MKNKILPLLILLFLASCKKTELKFSCDPVINDFVTQNQKELSTLKLQELNTYNAPLQKAIFNSYSEAVKRKVWIEKLQFVLKNGSFNNMEKNHIKKLIDHIDEKYFNEKRLQETLTLRTKFASNWINYAREELKWSKDFIAFIVYRLYTQYSQMNDELSGSKSMKKSVTANSEVGDCSCNTNADFCGGTDCRGGDCRVVGGCGWFWTTTCNGTCNL